MIRGLLSFFAEFHISFDRRRIEVTGLCDRDVREHGPDTGIEDIFENSWSTIPVIPSQRYCRESKQYCKNYNMLSKLNVFAIGRIITDASSEQQ